MPRKRHQPEEIIAKLRQVDVLISQGNSVAAAVRAIGVTPLTYYRWTNLIGGLPIVIDGFVVGAIGAGSGTGPQDLQVARAGAAPIAGAEMFEDFVPRGAEDSGYLRSAMRG